MTINLAYEKTAAADVELSVNILFLNSNEKT